MTCKAEHFMLCNKLPPRFLHYNHFGDETCCRFGRAFRTMTSGGSDDGTRLSLASVSIDAAQLFESLCVLFENAECGQRTRLSCAIIKDQLSRFLIWCGDLGALQRLPSTSSLDYRLRDSPKIALQIQELLSDSCDIIADGNSYLL